MLELRFHAISDVGQVRKDNQDSGYAGPWLLTVCDGVGGAARGDIASSTAVQQLRSLDQRPVGESGTELETDELLGLVAGALHRAHDRIGDLVDEDPSLNGTSTTATVALFDGARLGVGHVGDSRAYLFRDGSITQITKDHTFVQSLIDEGRITEEEARVHPHRNLILRALDGMHEVEPDLFVVELAPGDRLLLCSDGCCGVLDDGRLADILSMATPDYAAVELVRASLEAGSSDNITCIVADVVDAEAETPVDQDALEPQMVGAAAELPRRGGRQGTGRSLFRGHRSGDTGELEPVDAEIPEGVGFAIPSDPPPGEPRMPSPILRWVRLGLALLLVVGVLWVAAAAFWSWSQRQYFVGAEGGQVVIYRGLNTSLPGVSLSSVYQRSDVDLDRLSATDARTVADGISYGTLRDARAKVQDLAADQAPEETPETPGTTPTETPTPSTTEIPSPSVSIPTLPTETPAS